MKASRLGWCKLASFFRYDVELFQRIEHLIGKKLPAFPMQEEEVMMLTERVAEAQRFARMVSGDTSSLCTLSGGVNFLVCPNSLINLLIVLQELREQGEKKRSRNGDDDDTEEALGVRKKVAGGKKKKRKAF